MINFNENQIILKDFILQKKDKQNLYVILKNNINIGEISLIENDNEVIIKEIKIKECYQAHNYETQISNILFKEFFKQKIISINFKNEKACKFWKELQ